MNWDNGYKSRLPEPTKEKSYTIAEKQKENPKAYLPWDVEADNALKKLYTEGYGIDELAGLFERTKGAIRSRLKKLGLGEEFDPGAFM